LTGKAKVSARAGESFSKSRAEVRWRLAIKRGEGERPMSEVSGRPKARKRLTGLLLLILLSGPASSVAAQEYEPDNAGHPLRILGYVVYPVGVVFDYLILRPAYWVGSHEPFRTIFGRTE
jgi:hypothetical protein